MNILFCSFCIYVIRHINQSQRSYYTLTFPREQSEWVPCLQWLLLAYFYFSDMKVVYSWQGFLFSENKLVGKRTSCRHPHIHNHFSTGWKDASWEQLELKNIFKYKCAFFKRFFSSSFICPSYWIVFFFFKLYSDLFKANYQLPVCTSHSLLISARGSQGHCPGCVHFPSSNICEKNG